MRDAVSIMHPFPQESWINFRFISHRLLTSILYSAYVVPEYPRVHEASIRMPLFFNVRAEYLFKLPSGLHEGEECVGHRERAKGEIQLLFLFILVIIQHQSTAFRRFLEVLLQEWRVFVTTYQRS